METLFHLFLVLFLARLCGEVFHRMDQPGSVGEILAGVLFASFAVGYGGDITWIADLKESEIVQQTAEVGIFTLILLAGIEMEPRKIVERSWRSFAIALGGMVLPLAGGVALAWALLPPGPELLAQCLVVGVALSITAIPASVRVLEDLGLMESQAARSIIAAAIVDDVLGLVLLAVLVATLEAGAFPDLLDLLIIFAKVAGFFAVSVLFGDHIYPHIRRGVKLMQALSVELSVLVMAALAYGALAEFLGLHWILGPFMAGLFFEPERVGETVFREGALAVSTLANGLLGPVFFFSIGLQLDLGAFAAAPLLVGALIFVAFAGKILGAGLPAYAMGLPRRESLVVGVGMCSRGAVELVILSLVLELGLLQSGAGDGYLGHLFSALVIAAVVTTLLTPLLLRRLLRVKPRKGGKRKRA